MGDNLDNIKKLDAKVGNRKILLLWPGILVLLLLFLLFYVLLGTEMQGEDTDMLWRMYALWVVMYAVAALLFFLISRTGPDISIRNLSPQEQARVNADCMTGYRFGDVIICRDCLLVPVSGARVSAVSYRDLLWIYTDKKWIRYVTRKNKMPGAVSRKGRIFSKDLGPQLNEDGFYNVMQQFLPWCFYRKTPEIQKLYSRNYRQLIQTVDERRAAFFASQPPAPFGNLQ
ncbi:MAG: hypothetical protein J1E65_02280 [Lachnospiraceae bacterium]|nr:hypothetical protein [Lachnospiraceae bacterium]